MELLWRTTPLSAIDKSRCYNYRMIIISIFYLFTKYLNLIMWRTVILTERMCIWICYFSSLRMFIHKKRQRCKEDQHCLSLNVETSPVSKKNKNPAVILTRLTIGWNTCRFITPRIQACRCQWHRRRKSNSLVCCLSSRFPIVSLTPLFMFHVERDAFSNLLRELQPSDPTKHSSDSGILGFSVILFKITELVLTAPSLDE